MCTEDRNKNCSCLRDTIKIIIALQNKELPGCDLETCARPFLGPTPSLICFNTRPVNLYNCCTGNLWTFPYTLNGEAGTSNVFRVESLDDCCCTCRILALNPDEAQRATTPYVTTDSFFTINLNCVGALKCLNDTYVNNI